MNNPLWIFAPGFIALAAYAEHVIDCINHAFWFLLVFGCVVFPIGMIHGFAVWFGWAQ